MSRQSSLDNFFGKSSGVSSPLSSQKSNTQLPSKHESEVESDEEIVIKSAKRQKKVIVDDEPPKTPSLDRFRLSSGSIVHKQTSSPISPSLGRSNEKETRYDWLINVRDANMNAPGSADYDGRSLHIPKSAWAKFTPFETQFWEIKKNLWDTIVFFKKGKFYELYEKDADVGNQRFSLKMTDRVNMRMVGVPEASFDYWCSQFIGAGFKVAKVDQKETALGASMRNAKADVKPKDKLVQRELSCILTGGTLTDEKLIGGADAMYVLSVVQQGEQFGVAFADASTASFYLATVDRDALSTLLAQILPKEIVIQKGGIDSATKKMIKLHSASSSLWNELLIGQQIDVRNMEYWDQVPDIVQNMDALVNSALGVLGWYLKSLQIDKELFSVGNIKKYDPSSRLKYAAIDGHTLQNLEIFQNTYDGGPEGTLWSVVERCSTPFGKRLLRKWLYRPLSNKSAIECRLDAVEALMNDVELQDALMHKLKALPDLERSISSIHTGRAKIKDFCNCLKGFEEIQNFTTNFDFPPSIQSIVDSSISLAEPLAEWRDAFDRERALSDLVLEPLNGFDSEFDCSKEKITDIESQLADLLSVFKKETKQSVCYKDIGKDIYLLEVPASYTPQKGWEQSTSTKNFKRYSTPETRPLVKKLEEAREEHNQLCEGLRLRFYKRFDQHFSNWLSATNGIAEIDCLLSLARTSNAIYPSCRPKFMLSDESMISMENVRHPCANGTDFVSNDINLGGKAAKFMVLTGANAAGKSTLLRTCCVSVILAQIGCYVPATSCSLTIVDRIMSRLGANDNIFANQSTFFVELNETKRILDDATPNSLVILDELGRGTSTYDGMAIAYSVLWHLITHVSCLGFFATHYSNLANEFQKHSGVCTKRMAVQVDEEAKKVIFLYKLEDGVSLKSYGMHVANMCGVDRSIVDAAEIAAASFEVESKQNDQISLTHLSEFKWLQQALKDGNYPDDIYNLFTFL